MDGLRAVQGSGTRQMLLLLVPAAALMLVLSEPITRIVYQRGEFDAAQTDIVAEALLYFSLSLPFAGVNLILIRTFFSLQLPWRPTQIALANLGLNAGLDAVLYEPMGTGASPRHRDRVAGDVRGARSRALGAVSGIDAAEPCGPRFGSSSPGLCRPRWRWGWEALELDPDSCWIRPCWSWWPRGGPGRVCGGRIRCPCGGGTADRGAGAEPVRALTAVGRAYSL